MEGYLLVPPERAAIIGRAVWKACLSFPAPSTLANLRPQPRFVTFGTIQQRQPTPPKTALPRTTSATKLYNARHGIKAPTGLQFADDHANNGSEQLWLTVYKQKVGIGLHSHFRPCEMLIPCSGRQGRDFAEPHHLDQELRDPEHTIPQTRPGRANTYNHLRSRRRDGQDAQAPLEQIRTAHVLDELIPQFSSLSHCSRRKF